ncbi:hypothetical protein INS49_008884 [Diaporthe citri]|uniref:uncharacterized protein n=1 Tax=Diaporthe citri TaxID=83186 RepID=UPI001C7F2D4C|nr:uncharacterized protein INS49_008884 [Diaporthe citri]KAG6363781.1 hypothetical protein INS49_008884 [Diaporthe citri]
MDPGAEKERLQYNYISGFGSLASFMATDTEHLHSPLVYRRFDRLATRDLAYYQSQLLQLQAEQDELDIHDRLRVDSTDNDREEQRNRIRDCAQDWDTFERAVPRFQSTTRAQGSANGTHHHIDDLCKERMDLAMKIRSTLKDYREALIQGSILLSMSAPSTQTMAAMSRYFHGVLEPTSSDTVTKTAACSVLCGASSSLYPPNMSQSQIRTSDYISLSKPAELDLLTNLLRTRLSRLFRAKPPPLLPSYLAGRPLPTISHLSPSQMKYYSHERVRFTASFITTLAAAILLFVPIFALYNTSQEQASLTLVLIVVFAVILAGSLAVMTTASRLEIFGACAAYSAVLVVSFQR